jgi:hypothetical protein
MMNLRMIWKLLGTACVDSENDRDASTRTRVTQGFNTASQGKNWGVLMCVSCNTGRNTSAPTRTQTTLDQWSHVQDRRRQNRQGFQSASYSDIEPIEHATIKNVEATET